MRQTDEASLDPDSDLEEGGYETAGRQVCKENVDERLQVERLIARENKDVRRWRALVGLLLVCTAALVTYYTWQFLHDEDARDFEIGVSKAMCYNVVL
jgi:hypothetical protein